MQPIKITLKGNPRSTGTLYKTMCRGNFPTTYLIQAGKDLKEDYGQQIKQQYKGKVLTGDLQITIDLYLGTKRRADWDNFNKLSMDAMTGLVFEDDSQIQKATVTKNYDKENPRIDLCIEALAH
jgi:Holliday junction resolvase RusA-like endonuclease